MEPISLIMAALGAGAIAAAKDTYDSFHIACAESAKIDILLTTDDRLLRKAIKYS